MRLLMFRHDTAPRLGVLGDRDEAVVDVAAVEAARGLDSVQAVAESGARGLERLREAVRSPRASVRALSDLELLAPLDPPRGNVLCVGRNYRGHAEERARETGTEVGPPTVFTKAVTTVNAPFGDIPVDAAISERVDWEVELGVVVGRAGRSIDRADALQHVFGYTVVNDVTARDIQTGWGGQWFKGKSLDGSCPMGPWVVTADEIADPQSLDLSLRVNGELKQHASTRDMIHPVDALIEWLSLGMTLLPGMLIATGTPEGVGSARTPPEYLHPGDVVESEVSGIGCLRNRVVRHAEWRRP